MIKTSNNISVEDELRNTRKSIRGIVKRSLGYKRQIAVLQNKLEQRNVVAHQTAGFIEWLLKEKRTTKSELMNFYLRKQKKVKQNGLQ